MPLVRTLAALHAGVGIIDKAGTGARGTALGTTCPDLDGALVVQIRSGDVFTSWRNGEPFR